MRIEAPGEYHLTADLQGAPLDLSTDAELFPPYTGEASLDNTCIEIAASAVSLDCAGHALTGAGPEPETSAGIYIAGSPESPLSDVRVENCNVASHLIGFYVANVEGGAVTGSEARRNTGIGFYLIGVSGYELLDNVAEGNDPDGILIIGSREVTLVENLAFYNRMRGITFEGCQDCTVRANEAHSHGVLGFAIYGSSEMLFEDNLAHDNRYHGFAILHEAGSSVFTTNESYANEGSGFFLQETEDNIYTDNLSRDNGLDGISDLGGSGTNRFEGNTLTGNIGYGFFSVAAIGSAVSTDNTFSGNGAGPTGSAPFDAIDVCSYTGFDGAGPCDPVFEGGPNLKDPGPTGAAEPPGQAAGGQVILAARIDGDPVYFPAYGDLWMPTWADDDRLFLSWGDGTGFGDGYPTGYPAYESGETVTVDSCDAYFPCELWCSVFTCGDGIGHPPVPLTDAGVLAFEGPVPEFTDVLVASIDVPSGEPFFRTNPDGSLDIFGDNDKPSSLLFVDGRLVFAGHRPAGNPVEGYLAVSDDYGLSWVKIPGSPWGADSRFRVLMFANMGQAYGLNEDGYVYAFGVGSEAQGELGWSERTVYLARVPVDAVVDYGAYEYFAGSSGGELTWAAAEAEAVPLDGVHTTGQASAMFHEGTGRYLFLTTDAGPPDGPTNSGALFEAPQPWGPWSQVSVLCFVPECSDGSFNPAWTDGKYIAGLISKDAGPDYVYFTIAGGDEHYQLQIGRLELDLAP
jgi:parallel beta-helix repeat protein